MYFFVLEDSGGLYLFGLFYLSHLCDVCHFCNQYMHCVIHCFCGYLSIYQWNPCKSLDFFNIFSDFISVYCEVCEILGICILASSPLIFAYKSVGAGFRRKEAGIRILCICFLKQLVFIYLFHYIVHLSGILIHYTCCILIQISSIHYKSSIYLHKSSDFLNIFEDFILEYC